MEDIENLEDVEDEEDAGNEPGAMEPSELLVVEGLMEAEIIKSKLENFGIPCMLKFEAVGRLLGITTNGLGKVQVMVSPNDLEKAKKILLKKQEFHRHRWKLREIRVNREITRRIFLRLGLRPMARRTCLRCRHRLLARRVFIKGSPTIKGS